MIFRIHTNKEYITTSIYHLRDTSLSLQAMGMLSFMLSCADNFKFSVEGLSKISSSKETRVRSALEELKEKKYLHVSPLKDEKGHIIEWNYDIYESPQLDFPDVRKPDVDSPHLENKHIKKNQLKEESIESYTPLYNSPLTGEIIYPPEGETTSKNKTKKSEKAKEKKELDMSCVPASFKEVVDVWLKYKKEKQQTYKQIGFNAMVEKLIKYSNGNPETAKEIILDAMSNNYSGFFPLKRGAETPNHLQNLPPEYIKLKNENNNEQHSNIRATANSTPADTTQGKPYSRISQLANTKFDIE